MAKQPIPVYIDTPDNIQADTTPTFQERNREPVFRQKYPRLEEDTQYSKNHGVSMTIQNETYTIRELLNKHTKGIMPDVQRKEIWQEDVSHDSLDLQKVQRMDLTDKSAIAQNQTNLIEQLEQQQLERKNQIAVEDAKLKGSEPKESKEQ